MLAAQNLAQERRTGRVIINEYIDVAKSFYEGDEARLVNGIMNRLARELRQSEFED